MRAYILVSLRSNSYKLIVFPNNHTTVYVYSSIIPSSVIRKRLTVMRYLEIYNKLYGDTPSFGCISPKSIKEIIKGADRVYEIEIDPEIWKSISEFFP